MKGLRPMGGNLRILFAFDPRRVAILLLGGDRAEHAMGECSPSLTSGSVRALPKKTSRRCCVSARRTSRGWNTRTNLCLSTLRSYVEALSGRLELRAVFGEESFELDLAGERRT